MIVTPDVSRSGPDEGRLHPTAITGIADGAVWVDGGFMLRCVAYNPPSMEGRTVEVFFPSSTIDDMLRAFRDQARDNRRRSGPQNDIPSPLLSTRESFADGLSRLIRDAERVVQEERDEWKK